MPAIPLPTGNSGLNASPKTLETVKNLFLTRGNNPVLSIRPGIDKIDDAFGASRGSGLFRNNVTGDEELYMVSGTRLIRIVVSNVLARKQLNATDITITNLGEITGSSDIVMVGGFTKLLIMEVGGRGFVFDQINGLVEITDVSFQQSNIAFYDNGRFVFIPSDGSPFFWSELDDPSNILPSSFADAEIFPDPNKSGFALKSSIYVLGSRSVQRFRYNSTLDTYKTYVGEESTIGYVGGMVQFGETFAFLGNGADGDFNIYAMAGQPQTISNDFISELINNEYSLPELAEIRAESFEWKGSPLIIFYLPRHTLVYYGAWSFWESQNTDDDLNPSKVWRISTVEYAYGYLWTGDAFDASIGVMRDSGNEYGLDIGWGIITFIQALPEFNFIVSRIVATATMGRVAVNQEAKPQIGLSVSTDGQTFNPPVWLNLGRAGDYNLNLRWGAPICKGYDHVGIEFTGYGNAVMNLDGVYFE